MTDHPRSRGEQGMAEFCTVKRAGSSPLTRGAHVESDGAAHNPGIIPAHAGSTAVHRPDRPVHRDHPRSRGEHST